MTVRLPESALTRKPTGPDPVGTPSATSATHDALNPPMGSSPLQWAIVTVLIALISALTLVFVPKGQIKPSLAMAGTIEPLGIKLFLDMDSVSVDGSVATFTLVNRDAGTTLRLALDCQYKLITTLSPEATRINSQSIDVALPWDKAGTDFFIAPHTLANLAASVCSARYMFWKH